MRGILITLLLVCNLAYGKEPPSVLLVNNATGHVLVGENLEHQRPLASITKLMTAMVALDTGYGLDRTVAIVRCCGGILPPKVYTRGELLTAMLVRSDNSAAETFANDYPGGREEFIREMNAKAKSLGMNHTHFEDASGLDKRNVSTAQDIRKMVQAALTYDAIRSNSVRLKADFKVGGKKPYVVTLNNTNTPLLGEFGTAVLSKTGFINAAGFCVAMAFEQNGNQWVMVILGAPDKTQRRRIAERMLKGLELN